MGIRITDSQQPNYPPVGSFQTSPPLYRRELDAWQQFLPRYFYEADVEYHPRARLAPPPRRAEPWRIGLVQNVLYERILVEYREQEPYEVTWSRSALDIGSEAYRPFYNEPYVVTVTLPSAAPGITQPIVSRESIIAVHEVRYGPRGFGMLLDPWDPDGYSPLPNQVLRLRMEDRPFLILRNWYGSELVRAEQVLVMRFWIIAIGPSTRPVVIGHSPPFTLVAWMQLAPRQFLTLQPSPTWGSYDLPGATTRIIRDPARIAALQQRDVLRPIPGPGPVPLLTGTSANARTGAWIEAQGLLPPVREPEHR